MDPVLVKVLLGTSGSVSILLNFALVIIMHIEPLLCKEFSNIFIYHLLIANMLIGMNDVFQAIIYQFYDAEGRQTYWLLIKIGLAVLVASYIGSLLQVISMTICRLLAILFPLREKVLLRYSRLRVIAFSNWGISFIIFSLTVPIALCTQYLPAFYGYIITVTLFVSSIILLAAYAIQLKVTLRHIRCIKSSQPMTSYSLANTFSPSSAKLDQKPTFHRISLMLRKSRKSSIVSYNNSSVAEYSIHKKVSEGDIGYLEAERKPPKLNSDLSDSYNVHIFDEDIAKAAGDVQSLCLSKAGDRFALENGKKSSQEDFGSGLIKCTCSVRKNLKANIVEYTSENCACLQVSCFEAERNGKIVNNITIVGERFIGNDIAIKHLESNFRKIIFSHDNQKEVCLLDTKSEKVVAGSFPLLSVVDNDLSRSSKGERYNLPSEEYETNSSCDIELILNESCAHDGKMLSKEGVKENAIVSECQKPLVIVKDGVGESAPQEARISRDAELLLTSRRNHLPINDRRVLPNVFKVKQKLRALLHCIGILLAFVVTWLLTALGAFGLLINSPVLTSAFLSDVADIMIGFGASFNSVIYVVTNKKLRRSIARRLLRLKHCF